MERYGYEPLLNARHFRCVTIQPGALGDDIVMTVSATPFEEDNPPVYEALSGPSLHNNSHAESNIHGSKVQIIHMTVAMPRPAWALCLPLNIYAKRPRHMQRHRCKMQQ